MKKLKRKDLILEHYIPAMRATVIDNVTKKEILVQVWKPKTMGKLPAYEMLMMMNYTAQDLYMYSRPQNIVGAKDKGAVWITGNPDHGAWDLQITKRMDYKKQRVDIYVCSMLIRPFSKEAQKHYEERMGFDVWDRMLLMWDSRQFDEEHGYDTSFGKIAKFNEDFPDYDALYRVVNDYEDIAEGTF